MTKLSFYPSVINRIKKMFEQLNWPIEDLENSEFNLYCNVFSHLMQQEQEMLLEITENYLRFDFSRYLPSLKRVLTNLNFDRFNNSRQIYVLPLLPKGDFLKGTKSGFWMARLFEYNEIKRLGVFNDKRIVVLHKPEQTEDDNTGLPRNFNRRPEACLLLVDDFVGSGETAEGALNYIVDELKIDPEKIIIISLIIQAEGYQRIIERHGVPIAYYEIRNKGISDNFESPKREQFLTLMDDIETMLSVRPENRLGYNQSEALVSLIKTPNNTFPVYWKKTKLSSGAKFTGPFSRL
jgi:hypothetical protein